MSPDDTSQQKVRSRESKHALPIPQVPLQSPLPCIAFATSITVFASCTLLCTATLWLDANSLGLSVGAAFKQSVLVNLSVILWK
jgi:hypothetical protein